LIGSIAENGSVRIILLAGQAIPVNHRYLKASVSISIPDFVGFETDPSLEGEF
jgi:hypothetical protein